MNTQHKFVAERAAAQHCPELLRRVPEPSEQIGALAVLGERLAPVLAGALGQMLGGEPPVVTVLTPHEQSEGELVQQVGPLAANSLYASGIPGVTLLAAIGGGAVLRLVDRAMAAAASTTARCPRLFRSRRSYWSSGWKPCWPSA